MRKNTNINKTVLEIVSNKPYNVRQSWLKYRISQISQKEPFDVSACIQRLNETIKASKNKKY